jgi:hypothetical protein
MMITLFATLSLSLFILKEDISNNVRLYSILINTALVVDYFLGGRRDVLVIAALLPTLWCMEATG